MKLFKNYSKPTPKNWRKLGDSLLIISASGLSYAALTGHEVIAVVLSIAGVLGKLITNFFSE